MPIRYLIENKKDSGSPEQAGLMPELLLKREFLD